ncbi:MAG: hypothetical protein ACRD0L_04795 [Acidimicrobiales bacterium]
MAALVVVALLAAACGGQVPGQPQGSAGTRAHPGTGASTQATTRAGGRPAPAVARCPCPNLAPGSNPSVLPGPVLVADHLNNRLLIVDPNGTIAWEFPRPGDLRPGQSFLVPDDAFFTPDGRYILATQEDDFTISLIDVATHRIVWRYGTPGVPGSGPNQLDNPDDAMMMPNGDIVTADIKNCRVLVLRPPYHHPLHVYGMTTNACYHNPPRRWGSPNGAFPMANGRYLVTEINGDWVNGLSRSGQITFSTHPPGVAYPSDTNEVRPRLYLTADYSDPGQIEEFTQSGRLVWRFTGSGGTRLNHPSLAIPLPNGDILANDDFNHRVIVVDPRTNQIVWQYGHTGVHGTGPGYLYDPDGVDLAPPHSFTITHSTTMGQYPVPIGSPPAPGALLPKG